MKQKNNNKLFVVSIKFKITNSQYLYPNYNKWGYIENWKDGNLVLKYYLCQEERLPIKFVIALHTKQQFNVDLLNT